MFGHFPSKISMIGLATAVQCLPVNVSAEEIALTFASPAFTLVGQFIAYENGQYLIETDTGTIVVPAVMVTCKGADCALIGPALSAGG